MRPCSVRPPRGSTRVTGRNPPQGAAHDPTLDPPGLAGHPASEWCRASGRHTNNVCPRRLQYACGLARTRSGGEHVVDHETVTPSDDIRGSRADPDGSGHVACPFLCAEPRLVDHPRAHPQRWEHPQRPGGVRPVTRAAVDRTADRGVDRAPDVRRGADGERPEDAAPPPGRAPERPATARRAPRRSSLGALTPPTARTPPGRREPPGSPSPALGRSPWSGRAGRDPSRRPLPSRSAPGTGRRPRRAALRANRSATPVRAWRRRPRRRRHRHPLPVERSQRTRPARPARAGRPGLWTIGIRIGIQPDCRRPGRPWLARRPPVDSHRAGPAVDESTTAEGHRGQLSVSRASTASAPPGCRSTRIRAGCAPSRTRSARRRRHRCYLR